VGVVMDAAQDRATAAPIEVDGRTVLRASPYPRPIPGVPPERNLNGISFAVANATGALAAVLGRSAGVRDAIGAVELLRR
jgi:hypothetical protein